MTQLQNANAELLKERNWRNIWERDNKKILVRCPLSNTLGLIDPANDRTIFFDQAKEPNEIRLIKSFFRQKYYQYYLNKN